MYFMVRFVRRPAEMVIAPLLKEKTGTQVCERAGNGTLRPKTSALWFAIRAHASKLP
jgi:hypothetical protein